MNKKDFLQDAKIDEMEVYRIQQRSNQIYEFFTSL